MDPDVMASNPTKYAQGHRHPQRTTTQLSGFCVYQDLAIQLARVQNDKRIEKPGDAENAGRNRARCIGLGEVLVPRQAYRTTGQFSPYSGEGGYQ